MKSSIIIALLSAFLAAGVPLNKRQDGYFSTTTEIVIDTIWTTTTIWVPSSSAAAYNYNNNGAVPSSSQAPSSSAAPPPPSPTTSSTYVPPVTTTDSPATTYVPPPVTTSAAPYVAPAPAPPPPPATTSPSTSGSGSTTGQYTGDITYYNIEAGTTSCGIQGSNGAHMVALSVADMNNPANPNANPLCNKMINIYYQGQVHQGTVVDTCEGCGSGSIDLTPTLFQLVAPNGDGRVSGVTWGFV